MIRLHPGVREYLCKAIVQGLIHNLPEERQRWYAIKLFERDAKVLEGLKISDDVKAHILRSVVCTP